ncbi:hypothetical protein ACS0TY_023008 [Phlomoides rotata]
MDDTIKLGPFGNIMDDSDSNESWDGKGHGNIVQIFVSHEEKINSIQYQYVENEKLMMSPLHGNIDGYKYDAVKLDYPAEYITWIRGYTSTKNYYGSGLCSVTFGTNLSEYGPFGKYPAGEHQEFSVKLGVNRFFGFHGNFNDGFMSSLGVYMKLNTTLDLVKRERETFNRSTLDQ